MNEQLEQFNQLVQKDESLQAQLISVSTQEELENLMVKLGQEYGYSFMVEDIKSTANELSQEQLDGVAGGSALGIRRMNNHFYGID